MENDYISHHGVKGQRWGIRKYSQKKNPKWYNKEMEKSRSLHHKGFKNLMAGVGVSTLTIGGVFAALKYAKKIPMPANPRTKKFITNGLLLATTILGGIGSIKLSNKGSKLIQKAENVKFLANEKLEKTNKVR